MGSFQPLSKERAEQIRQAMSQSRSAEEGLTFDDDGNVGTAPLSVSPEDRRNVIGKYDTHYLDRREGMAAGGRG